jgi:hypothetical protein
MLRFNKIDVRIGVAVVLFMLPLLRVSAQDLNNLGKEDVPFKDRIAIRTNVVDWALTVPNIAFDYDIVSTPYDKKSIGLGLRYNWNASHHRLNGDDWLSRAPGMVFNLFDARVDYRFYWRQQPFDNRSDAYGDWEREWIDNAKGFGKLRARANCFRAAENPKTHLSFFVGPYLSVSTFSFKLNADAIGRQGFAVGAGLTGGVALPLYGYQNGSALDLEFGGSLGLHFSSFDFYGLDIENEEFQSAVNKNGKGHRNMFIPFPSELRVSLVYRFRSISKQHTEINYALIDRRYVARLMEGDQDKISAYNDSIGVLKAELDRRNKEIAQYKQTVESEPGFNQAYSLEYLTPYVYMMEAPKRYTRHNKDTLPKVEIDSFEQIIDPILLSVRAEIDSIPHMTSAEIDQEFVKQYNNISGAAGKAVNRTALIREIYIRLNEYVENNNSKLVASTFGTDVYSEKVYKYDAKKQGRSLVEIVYKDSVRTMEMTDNDRIEWLNNIKKQAWADEKMRMQGNHPGRVELPEIYDFLAVDSVQADSVVTDSVMTDSLASDSMKLDSAFVGAILTDSLSSDSIFVDSLHQVANVDEPVAKKSKAKNSAKAAKTKKKVKKAKLNVSEEMADSVTKVVADSVVTLVELADSVVDKMVSDTILQPQAKKAAKAKKTKAEKPAKVKKTKKKAVEVVDSVKTDGLVADSLSVDSVQTVAETLLDSVLADVEETALAWYTEKAQEALPGREYYIKEEDED